MAKNLANVLIGGGAASAVYAAPKGSTLPTTLAAPDVAFKDVGWISEDGKTFARDQDMQTKRGHQGGGIVKRIIASTDDSFKFQCLETTALVLGLMYKGQVPTVVSTVATINVTNQNKLDERAWVLDEILDDGSQERYVIPQGTVTLTAEVTRKHDDLTVYEFTVWVTGDYSYLTNAPGVIA